MDSDDPASVAFGEDWEAVFAEDSAELLPSEAVLWLDWLVPELLEVAEVLSVPLP